MPPVQLLRLAEQVMSNIVAHLAAFRFVSPFVRVLDDSLGPSEADAAIEANPRVSGWVAT